MRETLALVRASWLTALSYRMSMVFSLVSLLVTVVPVYFVARALQPVAAKAIATQGGDYFSFLLVGYAAFMFISVAVNTIPGVVSGGISTGTLEALLSTRAPIPALVSGMVGYSFLWTTVKALVLLTAGVAFGMRPVLGIESFLTSVLILVLIVLAYVPFGILAAALVLAFRTTGPLPSAVLIGSGLLGGVYYPTQVIPSWIQLVSKAVPLTYGLRALRQTLLEGYPLSVVMPDVMWLVGFVILLTAISLFAITEALRYARRTGTLAQY